MWHLSDKKNSKSARSCRSSVLNGCHGVGLLQALVCDLSCLSGGIHSVFMVCGADVGKPLDPFTFLASLRCLLWGKSCEGVFKYIGAFVVGKIWFGKWCSDVRIIVPVMLLSLPRLYCNHDWLVHFVHYCNRGFGVKYMSCVLLWSLRHAGHH